MSALGIPLRWILYFASTTVTGRFSASYHVSRDRAYCTVPVAVLLRVLDGLSDRGDQGCEQLASCRISGPDRGKRGPIMTFVSDREKLLLVAELDCVGSERLSGHPRSSRGGVHSKGRY